MIDRICIIALVSILFYLKTITYKYCSDDIPAFNRPKHPGKFLRWFFLLDGQARLTPQFDHALTMFLHTAVSVMIYVAFGMSDISFLAALLFCFNPTGNQGSVWIAGRGYVLPALGMLTALAFPAIGGLMLLCVAYFNIGFTAPLILLGSKAWYLVLLMPIVWAWHWKRFRFNVGHKIKQEMFAEDRQMKPEKVVLAVKTFGFYTTLSLIPFKNTFYHSFLQSAAGCMKDKAYTMKDRFFLLGLAWMGFFGWYLVTQPWSLVSLGLLWWIIGILPFLNFFRLHQECAERYCYFPMVGLMYALASVLWVSPVLSAVFVTMYATRMWFFMDAYFDDYVLVEAACLYSPDSWFAWHVRGMKRWDAKSFQEALILWTMARLISNKEFKINFNIANALRLSNNPEHHKEAKQFIEVAKANIPGGQEFQAGKLIEAFEKGNCNIVL